MFVTNFNFPWNKGSDVIKMKCTSDAQSKLKLVSSKNYLCYYNYHSSFFLSLFKIQITDNWKEVWWHYIKKFSILNFQVKISTHAP